MSSEDSFRRFQKVISREPDAGDYDPKLWFVRSFAALGIIIGMAGLAFMPFGLIIVHEGALRGDPRIHLFDVGVENPSINAIWLCVSSLCGIGLALLLLVGSVGALRLRRWSRPVLLLWAIASLALGAAGCAFNLRWLLSSQREQFAQVRGVVDSLVSFGGWAIGSALAIAMLVVLSRPSVRAAFLRDGAIDA